MPPSSRRFQALRRSRSRRRLRPYFSDPGFVGRDYATVSFRDGDATFTDAIEIDVRRAVRENPLAAAHAH